MSSIWKMKRVKIKLKIVSTNKNFLTENIFTVNQFSYFIRVKFLITSSLVVLKIYWRVKLSKVILETWKQDIVNHDVIFPFLRCPYQISLFHILLLFHVFRSNHLEVLYTWERVDVFKNYMNFYDRYEHTAEGKAFCKTAIL